MVYANERNESCFQIAQMQVYQVAKVGNICEPNKFIMVHKQKKEWREPLLSSLPCKLGSGKTRRKENAKEESTPYDGSIYQISTYRTE